MKGKKYHPFSWPYLPCLWYRHGQQSHCLDPVLLAGSLFCLALLGLLLTKKPPDPRLISNPRFILVHFRTFIINTYHPSFASISRCARIETRRNKLMLPSIHSFVLAFS